MDSKIPKVDALEDGQRPEYLAGGIEWMLRMGFLESPDVQVALTANVYVISERIEEVSLVVDTETRKMLIYIKLSESPKPSAMSRIWALIKRIFGKVEVDNELTQEEIGMMAADKIHQALPDYDLRVVFDESLYLKSKELAEKLRKFRVGEKL